MRRLDILNISPSASPSIPSTIEIDGIWGDLTSIFHGKEWINGAGSRSPFYTYTEGTAPVGTVVLIATTFDIVENTKYNGRYTVYTTPLGGLPAAEYSAGTTKIHVNEALPTGVGSELTDGFVTHISTYLLTAVGESSIVVLEQSNNNTRPIELLGKFSQSWAEVMMQNLLATTQCFAGATPPANPFLGQLWYDTGTNLMKVRSGPTLALSSWAIVNADVISTPFKHVQTIATNSWMVTHNLGLAAPYIASCDIFVNTIDGVRQVIPMDIIFNDGNTLTVALTNAQTGYVLVRS